MQDEQKNDVNLNVLGTGCAASCGTSCLGIIIIFLFVFMVGAQTASNSPTFFIIACIVGFIISLATGYFIGRSAQKHNAPVNFHVIIFGLVLMVIDLLGFLTTKNRTFFSSQMMTLFTTLHLLRWLLTIPLMLLGASWAKEEKIT